MQTLTHVFFDVGGVLGSNGWDREQRARAVSRFGLDSDFEHRHHEVVGALETGAMSLDEYLDITVFSSPRTYSRADFAEFMRAQSEPNEGAIALARRVAATGRVRLMTLNNESAELNRYRIERFGLREIFSAFLSSCWLGCAKPSRTFFDRALGIAEAAPERCLLIDDREQNVSPARALGMRAVLFTGTAPLERDLADAGLL